MVAQESKFQHCPGGPQRTACESVPTVMTDEFEPGGADRPSASAADHAAGATLCVTVVAPRPRDQRAEQFDTHIGQCRGGS